MTRTAARDKTNPARKFSASCCSKTFVSISHSLIPPAYPPTAFTKQSSRPCRSTIPSINLATAPSSVTSTAYPSSDAPSASTSLALAAFFNSSKSPGLRNVTTTRAPASTNAKLTARPNPPVPPATNTTLPAILLSNRVQSTHLVTASPTAQAAAPSPRCHLSFTLRTAQLSTPDCNLRLDLIKSRSHPARAADLREGAVSGCRICPDILHLVRGICARICPRDT